MLQLIVVSRKVTRPALLATGIAGIIIASAGSLRADVEVTKFSSGQLLKADDLNKNFQNIAAAIDRPMMKVNGNAWSLNAVYKGFTAPTQAKIQHANTPDGYPAAKKQCEDALNSPSAHMCMTDELIRSFQLGVALTTKEGWVAVGVNQLSYQGSSYVVADDCDGYTTNQQSCGTNTVCYGHVFSQLPAAGTEICTTSLPILCCD